VDPIISSLIEDQAGDVVAVLYHPSFTSPFDPFYLHNPGQSMDRVDYYYVTATPRPIFDGVVFSYPPYTMDYFLADLAERETVSTPVSLDIEGYYSPGGGAVEVSVTATTEQMLPPGDYRLHIVLTESDIYFNGTGYHDIHDHTMRRMFPDPEGTTVSFAGNLPQSTAASAGITLDPEYVPENCRVVCFLQENGSREVWQAAAVQLTDLPPATATATASWSQLKAAFSSPR
jgi:hypothetical protein